MTIRAIRVYADTSVFGGIFDDEFATASQLFFEQVQQGQFQLITSQVVAAEINLAPEAVQEFFSQMLTLAEVVEVSEDALKLQQAYLNAKIVSPKSSLDALHVALATVTNCRLIVSWNFKHIVHFQKVPLYRAINLVQGFSEIDIYSPLEVINYEDNEEI